MELDQNWLCQNHSDLRSDQKMIIQRVNIHEKKINDVCARTRVLETTCIFDPEHQRTITKLDRIQEAQVTMKEAYLTAISDMKIIVEKNNLKVAIITGSIVFFLSLLAQYLIKNT